MAGTTLLRQVGRPSKIEAAMATFLVDVSNNIKAQQDAQGMNASGASQNSHVVTITKPNQGEYSAAEYYTFLFTGQGRRRGTWPNIDNIQDWIVSKGIRPQGMTLKQLVFLISRKIKDFGTEITQGNKGIDLDASLDAPMRVFVNQVGDDIAKDVSDATVAAFSRIPNTTVK